MDGEADDETAASRNVGFGAAIFLGIKNYGNLDDRTSRGGFWWFRLALLLVEVAIAFVDLHFFSANDGSHSHIAGGPLGDVFFFAAFIPSVAITVRRLHDIGRSGWWVFIGPTIIGLFVLLYWLCQPGTRGENKYGPDIEAGR